MITASKPLTDTAETTATVATTRRRLQLAPWYVTLSMLILGILVLAAILAPVIAPFSPTDQSLLSRLTPPAFTPAGNDTNILGTDELGRDLLSRVIHALRPSILIATLGTMVGLVIGSVLGMISGAAGGRIDELIMTAVDAQLAVPFILIALIAVTIFGSSFLVLVVVIGFAGWESYARLVRGQVLAVREQPYVEAALAMGARSWQVALRHLLPNITSPILVMATMNFTGIILLETSLSFLGLGIQPPTPSLGSMVGAGRDYMARAWWIIAVPSVALFMLTMSTALIGDWLRDRLDSRL